MFYDLFLRVNLCWELFVPNFTLMLTFAVACLILKVGLVRRDLMQVGSLGVMS